MQNAKCEKFQNPSIYPCYTHFFAFFCHISNNAKAALKITATGVVLMKTAAGI